MIEPILPLLSTDDDPALWQVVLRTILSDVEKEPGLMVEIGRCSHWLRPHQARWTADGGFAWPTGYGSGSGGYSMNALPQFDWSVVLRWNGVVWEEAKRQSIRYAARITIPSRTGRHEQAAVHTLWMTGKEKERRFYGFRKQQGEWKCTAVS